MSVVLPLPFAPRIATRSAQFTSRSTGPRRRNPPRSMIASARRNTTSPLRGADSISRAREIASSPQGFSILLESLQVLLG